MMGWKPVETAEELAVHHGHSVGVVAYSGITSVVCYMCDDILISFRRRLHHSEILDREQEVKVLAEGVNVVYDDEERGVEP